MGLRAGLDRCKKSRPHRDFFYSINMFNIHLSCHVEFMLPSLHSFPWIPLPLQSASPCKSPLTQLLGARNVHLFTDGVHSPVSLHPSVRTFEIIQGLRDSSLLGSHVAWPGSPSTGSYVESRSTPALIVSNPHVSYTTSCEPGSKVLPYGVGVAKA